MITLSKWLNIFIWPIDEILSDTTILGKSGPGINCKDLVLHICQNLKTEILL